MSKNRYRFRWLNTVELLALPLLMICGCSPDQPTQSELVRPVRSMVIAAGDGIRIRSFPGTAEAAKRAELAFQVPGLLIDLPVREGQEVKLGEVIAQLRKDEFEARLTSLQGQLDQARAELSALKMGERPEEQARREAQVRSAQARATNARAELDRLAGLLPGRSISQAEYDLGESNYRVAVEDLQAARQMLEMGTIGRTEDILAKEAQVRGLEGRVVEASIQLDDCTLRAPYDGVIAQRFVEQGQNVRAKEPVVRFQDVDEVEILVDVPETVMSTDIRRADILQIVAEFSGAPGMRFPVHIREMAQVADSAVQTFSVRVAMQAPTDIRVLPGMTATVTVDYRRAGILGDHIMVPISAIDYSSESQPAVWIVGSDDLVSSRSVKVGSVIGGQIEIQEGLEVGNRIVVAGVSFLREGMKVSDLGDGLGAAQL